MYMDQRNCVVFNQGVVDAEKINSLYQAGADPLPSVGVLLCLWVHGVRWWYSQM